MSARREASGVLGDARPAVREDPERGFAVEGYVTVPLMCHTPGVTRTSGRVQHLVAGARYARVCALPVPLRLPVEGRVALAA